MVTYDTRHCLRLYKIKIDWAMQQNQPQEGQQQQPAKVVNPTLKVTAAKLDTNCMPTSSDLPETGDLSAFGASDSSQYMLTHLELITPSSDHNQADQQKLFPSVVTVFKNVSSILPTLTSTPAPAHLSATTLMWTWEMQPAHHSTLSSAFDQLAAKKKSTGSVKPRQFLKFKPNSPIPIDNTVLSITSTRSNTVLAVAMADGSVEFLKRDTMEPMQAEYNFSSVYTLSQSGFAFPASKPVLATELSPNLCCALSIIAESGETKLRAMESTIVDLANPENAQQRSATAAVLALQWSSGLFQFKSCLDDVFAVVQPHGDPDLQNEIIEKAYSAIGINLDFAGEDAQKSSQMFFRTPWLQKLVAQQAVSDPAKNGRRSLSAKLAYLTLNARLAAFVTMMVFRRDQPLQPGMLPALVPYASLIESGRYRALTC